MHPLTFYPGPSCQYYPPVGRDFGILLGSISGEGFLGCCRSGILWFEAPTGERWMLGQSANRLVKLQRHDGSKKGGRPFRTARCECRSCYSLGPLDAASASAILFDISALSASRLKLAPRCIGG